MQPPEETYSNTRGIVTRRWLRMDTLPVKHPRITQVYAVVFDNQGNILIGRQNADSPWVICGGSPENGETIEQTLQRELLEELDVTVKNIMLLGVQEVEWKKSKKSKKGEKHYQVRMIADIDELLPQTTDPAHNIVWERKIVPAQEITNYVSWGVIGEALFKDAILLWKTRNGVVTD